MEGAEWVFNEATNSWKQIDVAEQMRSQMKKMSAADIEAKKFAMFEQFLNSLAK